MSTLHTTLAQDSFRLYFSVIDYVTEHLKKDLRKKGKDEEEVTSIVDKLKQKWKENLNKSHCIDNKNMMGYNVIPPSGSSLSPNDPAARSISPNPNPNPLHNADQFNPAQSTDLYMDLPPSLHENFAADNNHDDGPQRKRAKLSDNHNHNHNHNHNYNFNHNHNTNSLPPPLHSLHPPTAIPSNFPSNNPHVQGLGVPPIDQVHNPFTHPQPQSTGLGIPQHDGGNDSNSTKAPSGKLVFEQEMKFIVQSDGPSPMRPSTVGFDDDDDDEEDEDDDMEVGDRKRSDKEENDNDGEEQKGSNNAESTENKESEGQSQYLVNGRDLNAPLCSDDDDTDDGEDLDPADKIICQFTKVMRKKNEWSVDLKHGLMHINGKDYAFQKAVGGSFTWE